MKNQETEPLCPAIESSITIKGYSGTVGAIYSLDFHVLYSTRDVAEAKVGGNGNSNLIVPLNLLSWLQQRSVVVFKLTTLVGSQ